MAVSRHAPKLLDTTEYDNFDIESVAVARRAPKELQTNENFVVFFPAEITSETLKTISFSQLKINDL